MKVKYCLRVLVCLSLMAKLCAGQNSPRKTLPSSLVRLNIGDACPDVPLTLLTGQQKRLTSYTGKAVVLDFMSIYCGTCVQELPYLQDLQTRLGDSVTILLVMSDKPALIAPFFARNRYAKASHLPIVVNPGQLTKLFPHVIVPHIAWLSPQHTVAAISDNRDITEANLRLLAGGQPLTLRQKKDLLHFNENRPVLSGTPQADVTNEYRSLLSGYIAGAGSLSGIYHDDSLHTRYLGLNVAIPYLYQSAGSIPNNLMVTEVRDTERLTVQNTADWERRYLYTYELTVPAEMEFARIQEMMKADFDRYFGYRSGFEQRVMPCWALVRHGEMLPVHGDIARRFHISGEDSNWTITHVTGAELVNSLNNLAKLGGPIFLDDTGGGWINLHAIVRDVNDVNALRAVLEECGLDLVRREKRMEVFVIRDAKPADTMSQSL